MHPIRSRALPVAVLAAVAGNASAVEPVKGATQLELPQIEVIGTTPLPALGIARSKVPADVQTATDKDLTRTQSLNLPEFMGSTMPGVTINEVQDNPYMPDVNFRGFTASPLLGTPQGLSVYVDGVRVNESFGDVVNWDLIPQFAISNITLIPGSDPLFGLNTLGGALAINTKSGFAYPGTTAQTYGGSFGRYGMQATHGGYHKNFDYFIGGNHFHEDGWRDASPSDVDQIFGKVGWEGESTDIDLSYSYANTDLIGNGLTPQSMLDQRYQSVFTTPDETRNRMNFVNGRINHWLTNDALLSANIYSREVHTRTLNGDVNDDYEDDFEDLTGPGGACAGTADPTACAASMIANGANNRTDSAQQTYGLGLALTLTGDVVGHANRFTLGGAYDYGRTHFTQSEQDAVLQSDRGTNGDGNDVERNTDLNARNDTWGIYFTDTYSLDPLWHLTLAGRYNHTRIKLDDQLIAPPSPDSLTGDHTYSRFNPAVGLNFTPNPALTAFVSYNEGSRAPTPIELGCANPDSECKLPNAMAGDPSLNQVIARTIALGVRGKLGSNLHYSASLFQTRSQDDILFVASQTSGAGYFKNFGETRRRGGELSLGGRQGRFGWEVSYTNVLATYESSDEILSPNNSTADADGDIQVNPGDRIPGIPEHQFKASLDMRVTDRLSAGLTVQAFSSQYVRGNENNQHQPDGVTFFGSGEAPGYAVLNLRADYKLTKTLDIFARVNNVFNHHYDTIGMLGSNPFNAQGSFINNPDDWRNETFYSPGAPIGGWIGIRYTFNAPRRGG
jgi:outer membrane receptor protein involved in Fe transport